MFFLQPSQSTFRFLKFWNSSSCALSSSTGFVYRFHGFPTGHRLSFLTYCDEIYCVFNGVNVKFFFKLALLLTLKSWANNSKFWKNWRRRITYTNQHCPIYQLITIATYFVIGGKLCAMFRNCPHSPRVVIFVNKLFVSSNYWGLWWPKFKYLRTCSTHKSYS